jgi:hypothetical protein
MAAAKASEPEYTVSAGSDTQQAAAHRARG